MSNFAMFPDSKDEQDRRIRDIQERMIKNNISTSRLAEKCEIKTELLRYILSGKKKKVIPLRIFTKIENNLDELLGDTSI